RARGATAPRAAPAPVCVRSSSWPAPTPADGPGTRRGHLLDEEVPLAGVRTRSAAALAAEHLLGPRGLGAAGSPDLAVLGVVRDVLASVGLLLGERLAELGLDVVRGRLVVHGPPPLLPGS